MAMFSLLAKTPAPLALTILSLICPSELSLYVGSLRLPPHRIALIIFFLFAAVRFLARNPIRLRGFDYIFALYNAWTVGVFLYHQGFPDGVEFAGSLALESFAAYFIARIYIRDYETFRASLAFLFLSMLLVAMLALPEALSGKHFVHEILHKLTGYYHPIAYETRLGLTRAYATFDHPILYGSFCASLFALIWYSELDKGRRYRQCGMVAGATFLGLSSAPLLCLMVQAGLLVWDKISRQIPNRVWLTVGAFAVFYGIVEVVSSRPAIEAIATNITLDPWTAYYRVLIWTHGLTTVANNPLIGIGLADWTRAWWMASSSVDAFWLVIMMRSGLPALLFLALAIGLLLRGVHRNSGIMPPAYRRIARGWTISLFALSLAALTVHYWNSIHAYYFLFLGLAGWLADPKSRATQARANSATNIATRTKRREPRLIGFGHSTA